MVKAKDLAALERIARIKADIELKKLANFSQYVNAARARVAETQAAMTQSYASAAPLTVADARTANAQAGRAARELARAQQDLAQMMPKYDAARKQAAREFGRAEALRRLTQNRH
ncbi:hypothetical protein [Paracoccus sp. (in: a-proteobacteria)]|uniref:hypothetical protein n=1 Tax=Paracoccus sp. TaxID=267 RepID=UPI0026E05EAE|nr:hypothetical protein [Paracoccus sp. (in: a-proteobacteria)]MDO5648399.1 hypothetical protein [Paracoccus sp. (in: a-proteobacteria)]